MPTTEEKSRLMDLRENQPAPWTRDEAEKKLVFLRAFLKLQQAVGPIKTDSSNPHFGSTYLSLEGTLNHVLKLLNNSGFILIQGGADILGKPHLRTVISHVESGYDVAFDYPLIAGDNNPQHMASAFTYARRISILSFLGIPVEDDDGNTAVGKKVEARPLPVPSKSLQDAPGATQASLGEVLATEGVLEDTEVKSGTSKAGKAYNIFTFTVSGSKYSSFDEEIYQASQDKIGKSVHVRYTERRNGKYVNRDLKSLVATEVSF